MSRSGPALLYTDVQENPPPYISSSVAGRYSILCLPTREESRHFVLGKKIREDCVSWSAESDMLVKKTEFSLFFSPCLALDHFRWVRLKKSNCNGRQNSSPWNPQVQQAVTDIHTSRFSETAHTHKTIHSKSWSQHLFFLSIKSAVSSHPPHHTSDTKCRMQDNVIQSKNNLSKKKAECLRRTRKQSPDK